MSKPGRKSIWDTPGPEAGSAEPAAPSWAGEKPQAAPHPPAAVPVVEQLRLVEKKPRDRSWERLASNRTMLFRRVPPGLREAIKEIAESLHVRVDDVARAFLEFSLACYQEGDLQVQPVLSEGQMTLFPITGENWGKSSRPGWYEKVWEQQPPAKTARRPRQDTAQEKPWKWQVSYRGLPAALQAALREIHQANSIPLGDVATLFLGHALDAYRAGRLVLSPQPRQAPAVSVAVKRTNQ